ncbi:hypothetical protein TWF481_007541 [Arthrobotrys musiformis]|uniref:Uncharacterized protein n=1 Tax=Arthrobotrys musiformis TaxID=47236 RepID=A0AAV9WBT7_9PEZI
MFFLKPILVAALLALQVSTAPAPEPAAGDLLEKRQSTNAPFTVGKGQFRKVSLSNFQASLDIQTFWKPCKYDTSITFVHENGCGSSLQSASKSRYMEITFRNLDDEILIRSRFNGTYGPVTTAGFTVAEATFETNSETKERLVRMSLTQGYGSWVITFLTNTPQYGEEQEYKSVTFTPDNSVVDGGIEPNYIWYQTGRASHLSSELQCGISWW